MKKIFTLFLLLVATVTAMAQDANTFAFWNNDGEVANGATITVSELQDDAFGGSFISSGLSVANLSNGDANLCVSYEVTSIDNGAFQICFPTNCISKTETGSWTTEVGSMTAKELRSLQCEWLPEAYGQCKVTLKIEVCNSLGTKVADGPSVNVIFDYANPDVQENWWGYVENNASTVGLGVNYADTYYCAIYIPGDHAIAGGKSIKAVRFGLTAPHANNAKIWAATTLPTVINTTNCLQVADVPASAIGQNNIDVEFAEPVAIPAEGIYVGYTFTITTLGSSDDKYPVLTTGEDAPNTLLLRTKEKVPDWSDLNGNDFGRLYLQVLLQGEFADNVAVPETLGDVYAKVGEATPVTLSLTNGGGTPVSSIDYTINDGAEQHADVTSPIAFNTTGSVKINVTGDAEQGVTTKTLTITKVNGNANNASVKSADFTLYSLSEIIARNVVVEQFTGTGCGWCPRGHVGMEKMREASPDHFIGIALHQYSARTSDAMNIATNAYAKLSFSGAPSARMDRGDQIDPYYGSSNDVLDDLRARLAVPALANVTVSGTFTEDNTKVDATANVTALFDSNYKFEFVLVADGLTGTGAGWNQANYYSSAYADQTGITKASLPADLKYLYDLGATFNPTFNDVAIASSYVSGSNKVSPLTLSAGTSQEVTYQLTMPTYSKLKDAIVQDKVYVVGLVIDSSTGRIVNAAKQQVEPYTTGVEAIRTDAAATVEAYFAPDGRQLSAPQHGLNIVRMSDGTVRKVVIK